MSRVADLPGRTLGLIVELEDGTGSTSRVDAVAPKHYGTFPVLTGTPDTLRDEPAKRELPLWPELATAAGSIG